MNCSGRLPHNNNVQLTDRQRKYREKKILRFFFQHYVGALSLTGFKGSISSNLWAKKQGLHWQICPHLCQFSSANNLTCPPEQRISYLYSHTTDKFYASMSFQSRKTMNRCERDIKHYEVLLAKAKRIFSQGQHDWSREGAKRDVLVTAGILKVEHQRFNAVCSLFEITYIFTREKTQSVGWHVDIL